MLHRYLLVLLLPGILGFKNIRIGVIFDGDPTIEDIFNISVKMINKNRNVDRFLPSEKIIAEIRHVDADDVHGASEKVCELLDVGVAAIFGPQNIESSNHVQSMCDAMEIPHVSTTMEINSERLKAINMYPHVTTLSMVFYHLIKDYKWKTYTILYDSSDSLIRMTPLLTYYGTTGYTVTVRRLEGSNYRPVLRDVKKSVEQNIILDCDIKILVEVLTQAQQVGLIADKYNFIVCTLDLHTINIEPFQYSGMNFTAVRIIDPDDYMTRKIIEDFFQNKEIKDASQLSLEQALIFDGVQLFARAFKQLSDAVKINIKKLPCTGLENWEHGISLSNFMRASEMRGLTGLVKFDTSGFRSDFQLDILNVGWNGIRKIGSWNSTTNIDWIPEAAIYDPHADLSLRNITFRVLISLTKPYAMLKESSLKKVGNDQFEGFGIDVIHELSKALGFNYTFIQHDPDYGKFDNKTGQWTGMIRKIMDNDADLAITDLTITAERESAVDFTMPFMNLGISILFTKPKKASPSLMSFLSPFSNEVWLYVIGAYVFVSIEFFIIGRMCPEEWTNPYPCIEEPENLYNQFSLKNALWFTVGAMMQQGTELAPIGVSTRMLAGSWWFFCLIIANSYTANLAACLTAETLVKRIENVDDLANQNEIKYGAKSGGSTLGFFANSANPTYKKMHKYMTDNAASVLLDSNDEGKDKVLKGDYAFLMESASIEYLSERECDLYQVNGLLDQKGYGIAMRKNSTYRNELSSGVLKLQENGMLASLKTQWWKQKRGGGSCEKDASTGAPTPLNLSNVGGVYLVLVVGIIFSFFLSFFELLWEVGYNAFKHNASVQDELMDEFRFILKFSGSSKPVKNRKSISSKSEKDSQDSTPPYGFVPAVVTTGPRNEPET